MLSHLNTFLAATPTMSTKISKKTSIKVPSKLTSKEKSRIPHSFHSLEKDNASEFYATCGSDM
eukprot:14755843-Ditylum_brightwellii.AAC.1